LGGGSSNSAYFMILLNKILKLDISKTNLAVIGKQIGFDTAFFVYEYKSANVSGNGEIVQEFNEPVGFDKFAKTINITTPNIQCSTPDVYKCYKENFYETINIEEANKLFETPSQDILKNYDANYLNDLFKSACFLYPQLKTYQTKNNYFSGSGSSFFSIKIVQE
jgi:4-diphosphocytidyl-2-C-methyl-D-erythritol kinase